MKFFIDDANVEMIAHLYDQFPLDGVTTNPSILAKEGRNPYDVLRQIRGIIGSDGELFVQVISQDVKGMIEESRRIVNELGDSTLIKIPSTPEGFNAMKVIYKDGIRFIGTAIYTMMQGYFAAKCGAEYVAPYVNRIDNLGFDGLQVSKDIHYTIVKGGFTHSGILAASFKNSQQVLELTKLGVKAVTVAPSIIEGMFKNATIDAAIKQFREDFYGLTGEGVTMAKC